MCGAIACGLFGQTVTVYRLEAEGVNRSCFGGAFLQMQDEESHTLSGRQTDRKFLLVLPGEHELAPGDRVYDGEGPEITAEQWASFIPACVPKLGQIRYVRHYRGQGELSHTEAGR